jgi:Holliday junction resolvasome RuvABC DNA-binding subunit
MEYIERNSLDEDIRTLASYFKNSEINKNISSKFLKNLIKGENIDKIKIMDSIMGTEILVLSFALSEKLYKEAVYSLISLDQEYFKDAEVIEKSLMPIYEEIDRKVEESLVKLGYEEKEAKEIASKLKFSERKLC